MYTIIYQNFSVLSSNYFKKVKKSLFLVVILSSFLFSVSGCSALSMLAPTPTLGVEATLGNKEENLVGQVGDKQVLSTESVTGGVNTSNVTKNIQEVPMEFMLLMVLGWLLPSPSEIYREIKSGVVCFFKLLFSLFKRGESG